MHLMEKNGTDARLDALNQKIDHGFERMDQRFEQMEQRFEQMEHRVERLEARFDAFQHVLLQGMIAIVVAMVGGFATVLAAVIWAS